jgi:hypothetical protein
MTLAKIALVTVTMTLLTAAQAATLADWNIGAGPADLSARLLVSSATGITGSSLGTGGGLGYAGGTFYANFADQTSIAGALSAGDYYTFSVTVGSGFTADFTSIQTRIENYSGLITGINFTVRSSLDGFTTDLIAPINLTNSNSFDQAVTLGSGFTGLAGGTNVEFRFITWQNGTPTAGVAFGWRNPAAGGTLRLDGTITAIPEPSTAILTVLALFAGFGALRRRQA